MNRPPTRTCIACRARKDKNELVRISCDKNNNIKLDRRAVNPGRGAYICDDKACLKKMIKSRALNRAFKCSVSEDVYRFLEEEFDRD